MKNKKHTEETKKKISEKSICNKSFMGHKHTQEWKDKMSKPRPNRRGIPAWNKGLGKFKNKSDRQKNTNLKKYGIDSIEFEKILSKQNYVCAVCLLSESKKHQNGTLCNLSVDHNHKTGKVRGLLCSKCNFAIGHLNDNPYLCQRAADYLLTNNN